MRFKAFFEGFLFFLNGFYKGTYRGNIGIINRSSGNMCGFSESLSFLVFPLLKKGKAGG